LAFPEIRTVRKKVKLIGRQHAYHLLLLLKICLITIQVDMNVRSIYSYKWQNNVIYGWIGETVCPPMKGKDKKWKRFLYKLYENQNTSFHIQ